jgi:hypothetical protein
MIPSTNTKLLVAEDWKKVYQSFQNADFKSYDFETLRRTMISYLREKYPEEFNDYIDSSEYIALVDVIAYLGQNLSFRIDLNARENFLETAQRRDSILRLAQLISYNPRRNVPATGFLKLTSVSTTDSVYDSNGSNLANTTIGWNDTTNSNWYQQFINVMNSAMSSNFGNPASKAVIDSISTEQYRINSSNTDVPIFTFSKNINGTSMSFEVVPSSFSGTDYVYEEAPSPANAFSIIYKNDNQGSSSINTGFFAQFKQGTLSLSSFSIDSPVPNEIIGINTTDINDTDTWLWQLDNSGQFSTLWSQVPSLVGNNVIYNSLNKNLRSIYAVTTRDLDQIDLNFTDGIFGDLPKGNFRFFYRQSNGLTYVIKPEQMSGIVITIPYINASGQSHSLQMSLSLEYSVTNSSGPESNASIRNKAPQAYYTQNRMITGEDYNIAPLTAGSNILKVKSVNRISSGLSKYFDISDVSGKYSRTNIFGKDGILYKEETEKSFEFEFTSRNQVLSVIKNRLDPIVASPGMRSFYISKYDTIDISYLSPLWKSVNTLPSESRGYFTINSMPVSVGSFTSNALQYIVTGSLIKFLPPTNKYFDKNNSLKTIPVSGIPNGGRPYMWATVKQVTGDGSNYGQGTLSDGTGPIIFSTIVPEGCVPQEISYKFNSMLSYSVESEIANICMTQRNFGLTIDASTREWSIIVNSNLDIVNPFSLLNQNNSEDLGIDASWLIAFVWTGKRYKVRYRVLDYIFESDNETAFFNDTSSINYDFTTNSIIKDKITVLSINSTVDSTSIGLGYDHPWQVDGPIVEVDGYVDPQRVRVSFYDNPGSNQLVNINSFNEIVQSQFVYFKQVNSSTRFSLTYDDILPYPTENNVTSEFKVDGQLFYFYDPSVNVVKYWSAAYQKFIYTDQYIGRYGRSDIKFHYEHNSGEERRIDPSKSNIIDIYVLTTNYDNDIRSWLAGNLTSEPIPPTSYSLEQNYLPSLSPIKAISDEMVFHPVKYKILFGSSADSNLQAKFKAVKNSERITTDNDLKTRILSAINSFFALENWDFGQSFHFGELSTYVMNLLTPDITNFVIVPVTSNSSFGSMYELTCLSNELFISGAAISDIEIIDAITASQLKSSSSIVTTSGT